MNQVSLCLGILAMLAIGTGCDQESAKTTGAPISLVREHAERSYALALGATNKVVTFCANMEYPSDYGISADEYERLTGFVNALFNGGTNFVATVDEVSQDVFRGIREASTNENFNADADLSLEVDGHVVYADARYFSYKIDLHGVCTDDLRCTYDRTLGRVVTIGDIVPSNRFDRLRACMREYIKFALCSLADEVLKGCPADWPKIKDAFTVDEHGLTWEYSNDELGIGSRMEMRVGWDELKDIVDPSVIPTARFANVSSPVVVRDSDDWWRFPFERVERMEFAPPNPPFAGTNYPHASVTLKIESPRQGGMTTRKFNALQSCLAKVISPHPNVICRTVAEAVQSELVCFWRKLIKEWDGVSPESGYGIYELETKIVYRGPEYVSFRIDSQDGCPCCAGATNVVWSWRTESPLPIGEVIDLTARSRLKKLMRQRVQEDFADDYGDNPDVVLPDYAKDWPHSLDNFSLDDAGVTWFCDAGDVLIGGKGPYETKLTWQELSPFLKKTFRLPSGAK